MPSFDLEELVRTAAAGAGAGAPAPTSSTTSPGWPVLPPVALYGLAGEVVGTIGPETEADPAALLATFLAGFGSAVGAGPHARVGGVRHPARLFPLVVGATSRARKGQSWSDVRPVLVGADPGWGERILNGFGSGEAVIDAVRDPCGDDPGAGDRRVLIREGEFSRILRVAGRDGSTLGATIRDAWDGERLAARSVGRGARTATDAHISVLAHITSEELERELLDIDLVNGFGNRFLIVCAKRSKRLASGGQLDDQDMIVLAAKVRGRLDAARTVGIMRRTPEAEARWTDWYDALDDDRRGMYGAITARAEAQVLRLSVAYALTAASRMIELAHLDAALAFWSYCDQSARYLFASTTGDKTADRILERLQQLGPKVGLDATAQHALFAGHRNARQLEAARQLLVDLGHARTDTDEGTGGRPRNVLYLTCELSELAK